MTKLRRHCSRKETEESKRANFCTNQEFVKYQAHAKNYPAPGRVAQSIALMHHGCRFNPQSGHRQEPTNECINEWNNKSISKKKKKLKPIF